MVHLLSNQRPSPLGFVRSLMDRKRGTSSNQVPVAAFSSVVTLLSVAFTDLSTDADGSVASWDWNWGDSTTHGTTQNPTHVYAAGGTYTVTLTVTDNLGATNSVSHSVTAHAAPVAAFTSVTTLLSVAFTDTSTADTASGATIASWAWTFGDAGTSTSQSPTHPYTTNGSKSVTLTVTDSFGATNAVTHSVSPDITIDGPVAQKWRFPQSAADFTAIGVTAPASLYLMQEAANNLADTIGGLSLTKAGSPSYQQSVTNYTTKALATTETTSQGWTEASGTGPSPASTSVAFFGYIKFTGTPGGTRDLMMIQGATSIKLSVLGNGKIRLNCLGVTADSANSHNDGNVHPVICVYNRTGASVKVFTDLETLTGTYGSGAQDGTKGFGALGSTNAPMDFLQGWVASGATAEGYGAATITALKV